jgi:catechol 2,3-dioxygenase-like lactoylglutathione lyase family enzyme
MTMPNFIRAAARLPAQDLERARGWYAEKLGLHPSGERPGGLRYTIGDSEFVLFASAGSSDGSFTQIGLEVRDHKAAVTELRRRGVVFEEYDDGPFATVDGVITVDGNYPDKGTGEYGAWFRDSEGNLLGLGQSF